MKNKNIVSITDCMAFADISTFVNSSRLTKTSDFSHVNMRVYLDAGKFLNRRRIIRKSRFSLNPNGLIYNRELVQFVKNFKSMYGYKTMILRDKETTVLKKSSLIKESHEQQLGMSQPLRGMTLPTLQV